MVLGAGGSGGGGGSGRPGMGCRRGFVHPDPSAIGEDVWESADAMVQEVVNYVHPTMDSEEKRKDVTDFMQRLVKLYVACEVFPYGSVPLKTYLPDGDIDLTVVGLPDSEEYLAHDVLAVLQNEEQEENPEFLVRDTHFIDAEVKLVRCVVQDIVIDISFNQLGGLCTLGFLEQVDRIVGKDHLFKRTIMLVKCWCYYESRILGAHHGLISTYALEILVLYIFQLFHKSLNTPFAVLYRFLDYYSRFDWDKYCISLYGPVCKSTLPEIVVEMPDNGKNSLLLSEDCLRNCMEMFSVPSKGETAQRAFQPKHLNIIDPLKEYNNLGRSVHRANYYRIRSAFKFGVRKLGQILTLSPDKIRDEIKKFFSNTIRRHGDSYLANLKHSTLNIGADSSVILSSPSHAECFSEDDFYLSSSVGDFEHDNFEVENKCVDAMLTNESDNNLTKSASSEIVLEISTSSDVPELPANDTSVVDSSLYGPEQCGLQISSIKINAETGSSKNGSSSLNATSDCVDEKLGSGSSQTEPIVSKDKGFGSTISSPKMSIAGDSEVWNPLADLTGQYDSHIRSLLHARCFHGYGFAFAARLTSWSQNNGFLTTDPQTYLPMQHSLARTNMSPVFVGPVGYSGGGSAGQSVPNYGFEDTLGTFVYSPTNGTQPSAPFGFEEKPKPVVYTTPTVPAFNFEDMPKTRGTGTFLPNLAHTFRDRATRGRRNRGYGNHSQRNNFSRGQTSALPQENMLENINEEASYEWTSAAQEPAKTPALPKPPCRSVSESCANGYSEYIPLKHYQNGGSSSGSSHAWVTSSRNNLPQSVVNKAIVGQKP